MDGDIFRASVPAARTTAGPRRYAVLALASSIIDRNGFLTTSVLAKAGDVSMITEQGWVRSLLESGRPKTSTSETKRYVPVAEGGDTVTT